MRPPVLRLIGIGVLAGLAVLCAVVPAAAAKDLTVRVCGVSECMRSEDPGIAGPLHSTFAPTSAPAAAPYYVVSFEQRGRERWSYIYVPSALAMRSDSFGRGTTRWQDASLLRPSLPDLTRLDPFPASATWRMPTRDRPDTAWVPFPATAATAEAVRVCGASACVETDAPQPVGALTSNIGAPAAAPAAAPFYVVSFEGGGRQLWSYVYVPSARAMRSDEFGHGTPRWRDAPPEVVSALPDLTQLDPHPASAAWRPVGDGQGASPWPLLAAGATLLLAFGVVLRRLSGRARRRVGSVRPTAA